ncbi:microsomal triacylglycerol transfer protein [Neodiprion lecontei]|uniref:Microsomal triacylglycerol transfer protein n=1 Tax=Neodiprion lecontei TaxID=441921 RepID=A0A6J0BE09_NEOLC|nr:microsomal triacylglycerol transfer protein [Neodiprion lecontei]XP_015513119.2 microsomal triacylglycerol transfer protein [Neodiprion lecontei]XP_046591979.1 microsomal triacylglycerol transfer protein [Neodiprion lecontei]
MVRSGKPVAITVTLVYLLALFGSYCRMAPAVAGAARGWTLGSGLKYKLTTTLLFKEAGPPRAGGDVGFQLTGELAVTAVWKDPNDADTLLLRVELLSPQLWIKSRKAPEPEGFIEHSSRLDDISKGPALVLWQKGELGTLYLDPSDEASTANLKRGLVSLFQYRTLDGDYLEHDASGLCNVTYLSGGPHRLMKEKTFCADNSLPPKKQHSSPVFGVKVESLRRAEYDLISGLLPKSILNEERHEMSLATKPEASTAVSSQQLLELVPGKLEATPVVAETVKDAIVLLEPSFRESSISLQLEPPTCPDAGCVTLGQVLDQNRAALAESALGSTKSALAFLKLLPLVREASIDDLAKVLKSPRYREIKAQLLDVVGSAATPTTHKAAMKSLRQDEIGDDTERYLWALSMAPVPHPDVVKDVLRRSEETQQNERLAETLALTAAALARQEGSPAIIENARVSLETGLDTCTGEECKLRFLRALRNLRSKAAIPTLLNYALNGTKATSVVAWRALGNLQREHINLEVRTAAKRVFYQLGGPRKDSSARTLALDIILETKPTKDELQGLVEYLANQDPAYEVRRYLSQRLDQLAEKDDDFAINLKEAARAAAGKVNNYHVAAQKGLSTAFTRSFLESPGSNGSLVTIQEVHSGLLKRGIVDVVLETDAHTQQIFSLGLFAGGLGGFVSSSDNEVNGTPTEEEVATAGMEIALLGVGIRPFVFFSGQGELMGHVWSGTASTRTSAFQTLAALHHHKEMLPLASGFLTEIDAEGAISFDLAGQVQLSLWSRNAQSLVEMAAGVAVHGASRVRSKFVQSTAEFTLTVEPKLELSTDLDFSGPVSLCMRLTQPQSTARHHVYKIERIPGSRHKLRKTRRSRVSTPAKSYLLNRKNSEMCSKVFAS